MSQEATQIDDVPQSEAMPLEATPSAALSDASSTVVSADAKHSAEELSDQLCSAILKEGPNQVQEVISVLAKKADINQLSSKQLHPFICAVIKGDLRILAKLIQQKADINTTTDDNVTALIQAILVQKTDVAYFLIKAKADVNSRTSQGHHALEVLIKDPDLSQENDSFALKTARALVEAKGDPMVIDKNDLFIFHQKIPQTIDFLIKGRPIAEQICILLRLKKQSEALRVIKDANADDVNKLVEAKEAYYPLHYAGEFGDKSVVQKLIEAKAKINSRLPNKASTSLMQAAWARNTGAMVCLLQNKASVELQDSEGETALEYLVERLVFLGEDNVNLVNLLLEAKADPMKLKAERVSSEGGILPSFFAAIQTKNLKKLSAYLENVFRQQEISAAQKPEAFPSKTTTVSTPKKKTFEPTKSKNRHKKLLRKTEENPAALIPDQPAPIGDVLSLVPELPQVATAAAEPEKILSRKITSISDEIHRPSIPLKLKQKPGGNKLRSNGMLILGRGRPFRPLPFVTTEDELTTSAASVETTALEIRSELVQNPSPAIHDEPQPAETKQENQTIAASQSSSSDSEHSEAREDSPIDLTPAMPMPDAGEKLEPTQPAKRKHQAPLRKHAERLSRTQADLKQTQSTLRPLSDNHEYPGIYTWRPKNKGSNKIPLPIAAGTSLLTASSSWGRRPNSSASKTSSSSESPPPFYQSGDSKGDGSGTPADLSYASDLHPILNHKDDPYIIKLIKGHIKGDDGEDLCAEEFRERVLLELRWIKNLNVCDSQSDSLLQVLVRTNNYEGMVKLFEAQKKPGDLNLDHQNALKFTAVMNAAVAGQLNTLWYLVSNGALCSIQNPNVNNDTALLMAIRSDYYPPSDEHRFHIVAALLHSVDRYKTINLANNFGTTPLMEAVIKGDNFLVGTLLLNGADPTMTNNEGLTAEKLAEGNPQILEVFRRCTPEWIAAVHMRQDHERSQTVQPVVSNTPSSFFYSGTSHETPAATSSTLDKPKEETVSSSLSSVTAT